VDRLGLLLVVVVHCAGIQDKDGAKLVFMRMLSRFPRLELIWAGGAYAGYLICWLAAFTRCMGSWALEIVKRPKEAQGFVLLPRRWVVERTFAWLSRYRRLCKDYEETTQSSEAWIYVAMTHIMVRRLAT
jgi:putative transposase